MNGPDKGQTSNEITEFAHDFNNLLNIIGGSAQLLAEQIEERDDKRHLVEAIVAATDQGAGLIRRLLVRGEAAPRRDSSHLNATVQTAVATIAPALPPDVALSTQLCGSDKQVAVPTDDIHRILTNLILNASEAMPGGGQISVGTTSSEVDAELAGAHPGLLPGTYGVLVVRDNGCGMSPEVAARVFEPFMTTKGDAPSRGLGLAIVFGLVKEARGYVSLEAAEGEGSSFRVYLPIDSPEACSPGRSQ